jgi:hypothetical protein
MDEDDEEFFDPLHKVLSRLDRHLVKRLDAIADAICQLQPPPAAPTIGFGFPVTTTKEGEIVMANYQLNSNLIGHFPLLVGGKAPPAGDVFTPVSNQPAVFSCAMGVMPAQTPPGPDDGGPCVDVTPLTLGGALGCSFSVTDSNGDGAASESFDIIPPAQPPIPISVDQAGIVATVNPNPPTV